MKRLLSPKFGQDLAALLEAEQAALQSLLDSLELEREAVATNQPEDLLTASHQKNDCLINLQNYQTQRKSLFDSETLSHDASGMSECFERVPKTFSNKLRSTWDEVNTLLEKCQQANLTNGCIISATYHQSQRLLDILFSTNNSGQLYDNKGDRVSKRQSNLHQKT